MLRALKQKFPSARIGDVIRIQVSDVDRCRADLQNVLLLVVAIDNLDFYKLSNKDGTLKQLFTCN